MAWREQLDLLQGHAVRTFAGAGSAEPEQFDYTGAGQPAPVRVLGIYRDKHTYVDTRTTTQVSTEQPTLDVIEANLGYRPQIRDRVTSPAPRHAGKTWEVVDHNSDGEGMWKLFLKQVAP